MKKNIFLAGLSLLLSLILSNGYAQQNNADEHYSSFLPQVQAVNQQLAQLSKMQQGVSLLTREGLALARNSMTGNPVVKTKIQATVKYINGPAGNLGLRIFKPDTVRAVVLSFHGGGWSLGTAANDDIENDHMARACDVAIVSVDYRLAPESAFPACINDAKAAARWLVSNSLKEFGTDQLIISGGSAGAHLSAVTTIYIRDSLKAIDKVKGVNLIYGCYDLSRTPSCRKATDSTLMLSKKYLDETFELVFQGWSKEQLQDPRYSPLYADLTHLPPALFTVGTKDPLIDDTYFMEARWRLAGNKTYLAVYPDCPHGFNFFPTQIAAAANQKMYQWINRLLDKVK